MKRLSFSLLCAIVTLAVGTPRGYAQPPVPGGARPPAYSPYLNLTRTGVPPAINYYGLVRPELQFRQSINNLQQEVSINQQAITGLAAGDLGLPVTGHVTQYMNHGAFFMNNFSGGLPGLGRYGSGSPLGSGSPSGGAGGIGLGGVSGRR